MDSAKKIVFCLFLLGLPSAWGRVFLQWNGSPVPPPSSLGLNDLVFPWKPRNPASVVATARKQGYRVYLEAPLQQAKAATEEAVKTGWTGVLVDVPGPSSRESQAAVTALRSAYPELQVVVLAATGKQPEMLGSVVIKRDSVLEVSSPTQQPWINTNLATIKVEQARHQRQVPLYTFSWSGPENAPTRTLTASDYALAVAEAGAFHADLVLRLDDQLQKGLSNHDADAWALWTQVRSMTNFYAHPTGEVVEPATNVAVVVEKLDTSDEVLNLLARHNIPFKVLRAADLKSGEDFDLIIVFSKPDKVAASQIATLASRGKTVVLVDADGNYPWHRSQPVRLNEHAVSYSLGAGKVLELSEPVTDPEVFAQDIRRLLGKRDSLLSLWNGLTTIAVPYKDRRGSLAAIELVNYAADPLRIQVQVKGRFPSIRYETPEHGCCEPLVPVRHDGFTEFVIPELRIAGRVHLDAQ